MSSIEDLKDMLKKEEVSYPDLLDILIKLERVHATTRLKIQMGLAFSPEMEIVWKISEVADRIRLKIEKKLNE